MLIRTSECKCTERWAQAPLPLTKANRQPLEALGHLGPRASTALSWDWINTPLPRSLLLPLLNLCVAEGGEPREAVLLMVVNHVFGDVFDGRKGSWEVNKGEAVLATSVLPLKNTPISSLGPMFPASHPQYPREASEFLLGRIIHGKRGGEESSR